jgi:hypothetical protein
MKLKSIEIANFKAFGKDFQTIPIKPITLVFGPNSAGKSSLIHSLLWLNHTESRGETDVYNPALAGKSTNLGGFDSCLNRNSDMKCLKFSLTIENSLSNADAPTKWTDAISTFDLVFSFRRPRKDLAPGLNLAPGLSAFRLFGDDIELQHSWKCDSGQGERYFTRINFDHPAMPFASCLTEAIRNALEVLNSEGSYDLFETAFLPNRIQLNGWNRMIIENVDSPLKELIPFLLQGFPSAIIDVFSAFSKAIRELQYLPPLRDIPDRSVDIRACELPGWRWLTKKPTLVNRINATLERLKFGHRIQLRKLMPVDALGSSLIAATCHAEAGDNWGALSNAVEKARSEWEFFDYVEKRKWLEVHPAFFREMAAYWSDIIRGWDSGYSDEYYEENPDKDINCGDFPPDEWIQQRAEELAWSLLDDWNKDAHSTFYAEAVRLHISENPEVRSALANALSGKSMKKMVQSNVERVELRLHDPKNGIWTALQDVGLGVSQSLPIILESFAQENKLIAIEQPELHLHPALQAELGDVFIESALGENKNTFLLETHSEHLILRILRRIRETTRNKLREGAIPVRSDDIAVLYVEPGEDGSVVRELRVNNQGRFIDDWPNGFFEERFSEEF